MKMSLSLKRISEILCDEATMYKIICYDEVSGLIYRLTKRAVI